MQIPGQERFKAGRSTLSATVILHLQSLRTLLTWCNLSAALFARLSELLRLVRNSAPSNARNTLNSPQVSYKELSPDPMPHSTSNGMPSVTNGDKPSSHFLDRLASYPVVADGIDTFKGNPYGQKSLELTDSAYQRFAKPVLPYLQTPYSYAAPYVAKADELADSGLNTVETHFPIVKEDTNTLVDNAKSVAYYPFKLTGQIKDYGLNTWSDEYKKTAEHNNRGPGLVTSAMALISTEMKFASDAFQTLSDFLGPKAKEAKSNGNDTYQRMSQMGQEKLSQGKDVLNNVQQKGQERADQAKESGKQTQQKAQEKTQK